jgi:hypothetical protein
LRLSRWSLGLLLLASPLAANPDMGGWLDLGGYNLFSGQIQKGTFSGFGTTFDIDYKAVSERGYRLGMTGPLGEAFSIRTGLSGYGRHENYTEKAGPGGIYGTYDRAYDRTGHEESLGFWCYPYAFFGRDYLPGADSPGGVLWIPSFGADYYQGAGASKYQLNTNSGAYSGVKAPEDYEDRAQGYDLDWKLPMHPRLTLGGWYTHQTWYQSYTKDSSHSNANGYEDMGFSLYTFLSLGADKLWDLRAHFPHLGPPGTLRLELDYGWSNYLLAGRPGQQWWSLEGIYVLNSAFAITLGATEGQQLKGDYEDLSGFSYTEKELSYTTASLGARFSFGSPLWGGGRDEAEAAAVPPSDPQP